MLLVFCAGMVVGALVVLCWAALAINGERDEEGGRLLEASE